jgi:hypothetical protein
MGDLDGIWQPLFATAVAIANNSCHKENGTSSAEQGRLGLSWPWSCHVVYCITLNLEISGDGLLQVRVLDNVYPLDIRLGQWPNPN